MIRINRKVPTGNILVIEGSRGDLECLSIGDYGKDQNIKADFLGYIKEIKGVPSGTVMPMSEKWVITISTQYGCSMDCTFCDVPTVGPGVNAASDMCSISTLGNPFYQETKFALRKDGRAIMEL